TSRSPASAAIIKAVPPSGSLAFRSAPLEARSLIASNEPSWRAATIKAVRPSWDRALGSAPLLSRSVTLLGSLTPHINAVTPAAFAALASAPLSNNNFIQRVSAYRAAYISAVAPDEFFWLAEAPDASSELTRF